VDSDWLEGERSNVRTLVRHAEQTGHDGCAWRLARAAWRFLFLRGYIDDIMELHESGLRAAERLEDDSAIAAMHNYLASGYLRAGRTLEAATHLEVALKLRERAGDVSGVSQGWANAAGLYPLIGRYEEAAEMAARALGQRSAEVSILLVLTNLGIALMYLGRLDEAIRIYRLHLFLARQSGDHYQVAQAFGHIGAVRVRRGEPRQAVRLIEASLAVKRRNGIRLGVAESLNDLGCAHRSLGHFAEAERLHRLARKEATDLGHVSIDIVAVNDLGLTLALAGRPAEALQAHEQALAHATRTANPYEQGRALAAIAACRAAEEPAEARRHWERALVLFRRMNVPERHDVARRLAGLVPAGSS
jgi:tetratricopeptide (TPR) repeat protein